MGLRKLYQTATARWGNVPHVTSRRPQVKSRAVLNGFSLELWMVIVAAFLLVCVFASKVSAKLGIPALILFIGVGMLAGSDGPGGIAFDDMSLTKTLGTIALAFILFAGGLDTTFSDVKPVLRKGLSLATLGVMITAGIVGLFAHYALKMPPLVAMLLGAVVSSTDAAAVFGVMRNAGVRLKHQITPLLEFESGTNDPVAVFLVIGITDLIVDPTASIGSKLLAMLFEMPIGLLVGVLAGYGAVAIINRLRLEYDGLYPVITTATVCLAFGAAYFAFGNPFLAVYAAGVTMGSRNFVHRLNLIQFHDAVAWLTQIVMFVLLGLLVFPSELVNVAVPGLLLSLVLILVARPVAVFISLLGSRMQKRTKFFISWAGLRGAVPIILATFPAIEGVPEAPMIFNLVFFIVVSSVLIQGTMIRRMAHWLSVAAPQTERADTRSQTQADLLEIRLEPGSRAVSKQVVNLGMPSTALIVLLKRGDQSYIPQGSTVLREGDLLLVATRREDHEDLKTLFTG